MRISILPKTPLGRCSVGLVAAYILLIVLLVVWRVFLGVAVDESRFQLVADTISVAIGGSGYSYTVFIRPLADHFGWSRATFSQIYSALLIIRGAVSIGALVTGLIGIIKSMERSILVFLTTAIGLYSLIGGIGSLLGLAK